MMILLRRFVLVPIAVLWIRSIHVASFSSIYKIHSTGLNLSQSTNTATIIFLSGFPDTSQTWSPLLPAFQEQYHIVTLALPDYESDSLNSFMGYPIQTMVDSLAQVAQLYKDQGSTAIYLVGHDWGAHICLCLIESYANAKLVDKVVLLDVGLRSQRDLWTDITSLSYMSFLATIFLLSRVSNVLANWAVRLYPWNVIGPCRHSTDIEYAANNFSRLQGFMTYPYFQVLFSKTPKFQPEIPQLFLYGAEKATMFHSQEFLHLLEMTPLCTYKRLDECGHWCHWAQTEEIINAMKSFLQTKKEESIQTCTSP